MEALSFALVRDLPVFVGMQDGRLVSLTVPAGDIVPFEPGQVTGFLSIDPAAVFYGAEMAVALEERMAAAPGAPKRPGRFQPRGGLFQPLPRGEVTGFPSTTLLAHRSRVPSLDVVRLSSTFAVVAIPSH